MGTILWETGDVRDALRELVKELSVHAAVEEMAVYPAIRRAFSTGDEWVDADLADHQAMKEILARLDGADPEDPSVDADIETLGTVIESHVADEEIQLTELRGRLSPQLSPRWQRRRRRPGPPPPPVRTPTPPRAGSAPPWSEGRRRWSTRPATPCAETDVRPLHGPIRAA